MRITTSLSSMILLCSYTSVWLVLMNTIVSSVCIVGAWPRKTWWYLHSNWEENLFARAKSLTDSLSVTHSCTPSFALGLWAHKYWLQATGEPLEAIFTLSESDDIQLPKSTADLIDKIDESTAEITTVRLLLIPYLGCLFNYAERP